MQTCASTFSVRPMAAVRPARKSVVVKASAKPEVGFSLYACIDEGDRL